MSQERSRLFDETYYIVRLPYLLMCYCYSPELQLKDKRLEETAREHSQLSQVRSRLFDETENIVREADTYNQRLQEELSRRGHKVETISSQLDNLRRQSEQAIRTKDTDLHVSVTIWEPYPPIWTTTGGSRNTS